MLASAAVPRRPSRLRTARIQRILGAVLFGLQLVLWGAAGVLEARPAAEALMVVSHVEDADHATCPPIHRHVDCIVCRAYDAGATGGQAPALAASDSPGQEPATTGADIRVSTRPGHGQGSRAPPLA